MSLVKMTDLMKKAEKGRYGVGAFNVGNMEMVRGVIRAAEETNTPVIMQIAEKRLPYSPLSLMAPMMVSAAKESSVDIAVHLDHGLTFECVKSALDYGFTSVMFDASHESFENNIKNTKKIVALAKKYGADVEAELGLVGGGGETASSGIRCTDPDQAQLFAAETGTDCLAVAIGNAHGDYPTAPRLAFDVLKKINEKVNIPLVLHGGSGISDDDFRLAISLGICKINIATASFKSLTKYVENYLKSDDPHNYFDLSEAMVRGTCENVKKHIKIFKKPLIN